MKAGTFRNAHNSTFSPREKPIPRQNRERLARLQEQQYGEYGDVIAAQACWVTGREPVHRAHVVGTKAAGHGPEALAALWWEVHQDFDSGMSDEAFQRKWKVSRADIRAMAIERYAEWLEEHAAA